MVVYFSWLEVMLRLHLTRSYGSLRPQPARFMIAIDNLSWLVGTHAAEEASAVILHLVIMQLSFEFRNPLKQINNQAATRQIDVQIIF